jgi:hypothetical protein
MVCHVSIRVRSEWKSVAVTLPLCQHCTQARLYYLLLHAATCCCTLLVLLLLKSKCDTKSHMHEVGLG